jgi:co-chaperonin GroES (HSP10)
MKPRLIKTFYAQYEPAEWNGKNESGWVATGDRIIVLTDRAPTKSAGGIQFTDESKETHDAAAITGVLIAMGDDAFTWNGDRTRKYEGQKPKPGERVMFTKYAGEILYGNDEKLYRVMEDRAVGAVMRDN